jgi:hypothetical protein
MLTVNGSLAISEGLIVNPTTRPSNATAGQIYYDIGSNQLNYFNGTKFIPLGGNTINNSSSSSNTNVINNSVTNINGTLNAMTSPGGTKGVVAVFTGNQSLGSSDIVQSGLDINVGGNLNLSSPNTTTPSDLELFPDNPTPTNTNSPDANPDELGVKFQTDVSGYVKGLRFYKGTQDIGTHIGSLWTGNGTLLARATFINETASGWQYVAFQNPVPISSETTYVVSYHTNAGYYSDDKNYFTTGGVDNGSLHALQNGVDGGNGVFRYSASPAFPNSSYESSNYWVDVTFTPNPPPAKYEVNSVQISSSDLSNNNELAKKSTSQVFTGNNTFQSSSTTGFNIQSASGQTILSADTVNGNLYIGTEGGDNQGVLLVLGTRINNDDPPGVEGAIYYNEAEHMFRCFRYDEWSPCAALEADNGYSLYDEYMGGNTSFSSPISTLGWSAQAIGANGTLSFNPPTPTAVADRPGILDLQTPAVANQGTTLTLSNSNSGSMIIEGNSLIKTAVAVESSTDQVLRVGLDNETTNSTQPISGVWWQADPSRSIDWQYCYGDGTTAHCLSSPFPITANAFVDLDIYIRSTGVGTSSAIFLINGAEYTDSAVTIDSTNRVSPEYTCYDQAGVARNCYWDYFQLIGTTAARR